MNKGTVKWFNKKGYGFIKDSEGNDIFVHYSAIQMEGFKNLDDGDIVKYEIGEGSTGRKQAVNVTPIVTRSMVVHELAKEGLHIMRIRDDKGIHGWYVVDKGDNPVVDKEMNLVDLAAYVGIDKGWDLMCNDFYNISSANNVNEATLFVAYMEWLQTQKREE